MRAYLHKYRNMLPMDCLVLYCYQLSMAVSYLESKKYVHRFVINFASFIYIPAIMHKAGVVFGVFVSVHAKTEKNY